MKKPYSNIYSFNIYVYKYLYSAIYIDIFYIRVYCAVRSTTKNILLLNSLYRCLPICIKFKKCISFLNFLYFRQF